MSLADVSAKFIELSGRPDLDPTLSPVVDSYWYINEGQKMLDKMLNEGKVAARYICDVAAGVVLVPMYACRAVKHVYLVNATERVRLDKIDVHTLIESYPNPVADMTASQPLYYTPIWARPMPSDLEVPEDLVNGISAGPTITYDWIMQDILEENPGYRSTYNAILIMPPPDVTYTLDIWGLWKHEEMVNEEDISYWTEEQESTLLSASLYKLEVTYRNSEGAKDWLAAIKLDVDDIIRDQIEEETTDINQMRG